MRKQLKCILAVLLVVLTVCSMTIPVTAANRDDTVSPQASAYISNVWASAYKNRGTVTVEFSITATGKMTSLGATTIAIKDSSGDIVKTFSYTNTSGMMGYNEYYYSSSVSWNGAASGEKYYALVLYKASNSSGYDMTSYTTDYT